MIDPAQPDFSNTPISPTRPDFGYVPTAAAEPLVSIITPYYNTGAIFLETVDCIKRMSFVSWEWLLVDDGSTDAESLARLRQVEASDARIRVIRQENAGPGVARNTAVAHARGEYLLQLDADDLVEPTFLEKALWLLLTQQQFAACGAYDVTFGAKNYLWPHGFQEYEESVDDNRMTNHAVIRKAAWIAAGGYDPAVSYEHADWDFWLNLAEVGQWGYTIPEYLVWYRTQASSLLVDIEGNLQRSIRFRTWLRQKHKGLRRHFPRPMWDMRAVDPMTSLDAFSIRNPLQKPNGIRRVLLIVPWLEMGGADKFNLDLIRQLTMRGYQCTIVTTQRSADPWKSRFTALTSDVFCLPQFLRWADYPAFISYLIESRSIDVAVISNSGLGYGLAPYLRWRHPSLALCDYNHLEEEHWEQGGYPRMSLQAQEYLDAQMTCTEHLRHWMVERDGHQDKIHTAYCGVDTATWNASRIDRGAVRRRLHIADDTPVVTFVGRFVDQKRPLLFAQVVEEAAQRVPTLVALMLGSGPDVPQVKTYIKAHHLDAHIRLLGAVSNDEARELIGASDILLLPSKSEGLALVLYEAMAMGVVPIAADVGGQSELVTPDTGILIAPGNDERTRYVKALERLLADADARQQLAAHGMRTVNERFDVRRMGDTVDAVLSDAMNCRTQASAAGALREHALEAMRSAVEWQRNADMSASGEGDGWLSRGTRRIRQRLVPMGTSRYESYKAARRFMRVFLLRVRRTPTYIASGRIRQIPAYVRARVTTNRK